MLDFQIFRIKVFPPAQTKLFEADKTPQQILVEAISGLPEAESRAGLIWHIGNVSQIDDSSLYFRIGRTSKSTFEVYNDGRFVDEEFETSPYTHVVLDTELEVCGIARKRKLARTTNGIARQLARLLNQSVRARAIGARFEISMINDPEDFITRLKGAYAIEKFWMTFTRPNAIDVEEDYIKPMERLLSEAEGRRGKTELEGADLEVEVLEQLSRSAASTGDDAGASIRPEPEVKIRVSLRGNAVDIAQDSIDTEDDKMTIIERLRARYESIREGSSGEHE